MKFQVELNIELNTISSWFNSFVTLVIHINRSNKLLSSYQLQYMSKCHAHIISRFYGISLSKCHVQVIQWEALKSLEVVLNKSLINIGVNSLNPLAPTPFIFPKVDLGMSNDSITISPWCSYDMSNVDIIEMP